ncbi:MAG TPA: YraN family protein [Ruminococcaceae bacterium]|nr:YraN family protein [Oscillospiraceae bacterium]HAO69084.1 YraN family protein [Oscillospiraceae bacterium]HCB64940.1 YraN family protein [Oscillospiraceae bacterium]
MTTREIGAQGETFAAQILQEQGMKILSRNYYTPYGEIDLIVLDKGCIAFVEVKTRRTGSVTRPAEAVDRRKRERIIRSAVCYLMEYPVDLQPRFDVFEIVTKKGKTFSVQSYRYIINAYEVTNDESF